MILALNNHPVHDPEQLKQLLEKSGDHVALLARRDDAKVYVPVTAGRAARRTTVGRALRMV